MEVTCLCGAIRQHVEPSPAQSLALCHCDTCRRSTGLLCASYRPVSQLPSLDGTKRYRSSPRSLLFFCTRCGCHMFRFLLNEPWPEEEDKEFEVLNGMWEVATGTIVKELEHLSFVSHVGVEDTRDGGLSTWIHFDQGSTPVSATLQPTHSSKPVDFSDIHDPALSETLSASCHCGNVRFLITRPDASSRLPRSNFPDLMFAYATHDLAHIANPTDVKWWLRANDTKFLAGTCACRSCRLASGFEIQTWAFVPRSNISFLLPPSVSGSTGSTPVDFPRLHVAGVLQEYESSPGVASREFCPCCGATVFWHDRFRSEVVDVSVGLLRDPGGALARGWLDWWTARVSFAEETERERDEQTAGATARELISRLEAGLLRAARDTL